MRQKQKAWLFFTVVIYLSTFAMHCVHASDEIPISTKVLSDYRNFYTQDRLKRLGIGFLSMGAIANTNIDENIQDWYQREIRSNGTDDFAKHVKWFGERDYLIPLSILASSAYYFDSDSAVGNWGLNSARAYAVGLPAMSIMQHVTGASRPVELNGSQWKPFADDNGVSGHAFIGAVPFLTLAQMSDDKLIKYASYFASTLAAWSRVNDDVHYTSQAILGWYIANESVGAVFDTNNKRNVFTVTPVMANDFYGFNVSASW